MITESSVPWCSNEANMKGSSHWLSPYHAMLYQCNTDANVLLIFILTYLKDEKLPLITHEPENQQCSDKCGLLSGIIRYSTHQIYNMLYWTVLLVFGCKCSISYFSRIFKTHLWMSLVDICLSDALSRVRGQLGLGLVFLPECWEHAGAWETHRLSGG